jgi:hypothetical protein
MIAATIHFPMINPYYCYALSFLFALMLYPLRWSLLYPSLSFALAAFLVITILFHIAIGLWFQKKRFVRFNALRYDEVTVHIASTIFIYLLWVADFAYEGGIPLIKILLKQPYNYRLFGLPSIHVFIVTFSSFYTVYLAHVFLSHRNKTILILYVINLLAAILIYNRGMFAFNLSASFFLFLISLTKTPPWLVIGSPLAIVLLLYFFGVLGTLRESREAGTRYDNGIFLSIGQASDTFRASSVPKEYFWSYVYITSPIANLQQNVNEFKPRPFSMSRLGGMINNELLMDFISKRVNTLTHHEPEKDYRIGGPFNVSTVYSRSYSYLAWTGLILMACVVIGIPLAYKLLLPQNSPFYLTGMCILCTMYLFLAFDNTIRFTGLSFQLVYPLIFSFALKKIPALQKRLS